MISLDASLLSEKPIGDVRARMQTYADAAGSLTVLVIGSAVRKQVSNNLLVLGTGGRTKQSRLLRAISLARTFAKDVDVISAQDPFFSGLIALRARSSATQPVVIDLHGDFFGVEWKKSNGFKGTLLLWLASYVLKRVRGIRAVNQKIADDIISRAITNVVPQIIPVAVDARAFSQCSNDLRTALQDEFGGHPIVLSVGRIEKQKGIYDLIEAFGLFIKNQKSAQLVVVGSGADEDHVRKTVARAGLSSAVHFAGVVSPHELACYYHLCDLFVLASHHESFGRVIIEAGAAGKPVIATETAGAQLLLKDNHTGYLVPVKNPNMLAKRMEYVWTHQEEARRSGEALSKHVMKHFNYSQSIARLISFWQSCI